MVRSVRTASISLKELHGLAVLKQMLDVFISFVFVFLDDFNDELVQRVIITAPCLNRIPADATMDFPLDAHLFRLHTELFLLGVIFQLQELTEALQIKRAGLHERME